MKQLKSLVRAISPFTKSKNKTNGNVSSNNKEFSYDLSNTDLYSLLSLFYARYNPSKLHVISKILEEFQGDEMTLINQLCERYNISNREMQSYIDRSEIKTNKYDDSPYNNDFDDSQSNHLYDNQITRQSSRLSRNNSSNSNYIDDDYQQNKRNSKIDSNYINDSPKSRNNVRQIDDSIVDNKQMKRNSNRPKPPPLPPQSKSNQLKSSDNIPRPPPLDSFNNNVSNSRPPQPPNTRPPPPPNQIISSSNVSLKDNIRSSSGNVRFSQSNNKNNNSNSYNNNQPPMPPNIDEDIWNEIVTNNHRSIEDNLTNENIDSNYNSKQISAKHIDDINRRNALRPGSAELLINVGKQTAVTTELSNRLFGEINHNISSDEEDNTTHVNQSTRQTNNNEDIDKLKYELEITKKYIIDISNENKLMFQQLKSLLPVVHPESPKPVDVLVKEDTIDILKQKENEIERLQNEMAYSHNDKKELLDLIDMITNTPINPKTIVESYINHNKGDSEVINKTNDKLSNVLDLVLLDKHTNSNSKQAVSENILNSNTSDDNLISSTKDNSNNRSTSATDNDSDYYIKSEEYFINNEDIKKFKDNHNTLDISAFEMERMKSIVKSKSRSSSPMSKFSDSSVDRSVSKQQKRDKATNRTARVQSVNLKEILSTNENLQPHMQYTKSTILKLVDPNILPTHNITQATRDTASNELSITTNTNHGLRVTSGGLISPERKKRDQLESPRRYMSINNDPPYGELIKNPRPKSIKPSSSRSSSPSVYVEKIILDESQLQSRQMKQSSRPSSPSSSTNSQWQYSPHLGNKKNNSELIKEYETTKQVYRDQITKSKIDIEINKNNKQLQDNLTNKVLVNTLQSTLVTLDDNINMKGGDDLNDWIEKFDTNKQKKYYFSPSRKKSVWKIPYSFDSSIRSSVISIRSETPPPNQLELDSNNKSLFVQRLNESSSNPVDLPVKKLWGKALDQKTNKYYWYNRITRETTWNKPEGL